MNNSQVIGRPAFVHEVSTKIAQALGFDAIDIKRIQIDWESPHSLATVTIERFISESDRDKIAGVLEEYYICEKLEKEPDAQ